jgi:glycosyltransferase involved in cell wall biosynthesis
MLSVITSVKNEGPYILEWLAHHKALGFDYIIVFENDSDDLTDVILQRLAQMGEIEFVKNRDFTGSPQMHSYRQFQKMDAYRQSDWVFCIDADEFFVPRRLDTARAFLEGFPQADAIAVNWLNFGSSGHKTWEDRPVTERFRFCAPPGHATNKFFKSFHRPCDKFKAFGLHRPWPHEPINTFFYTDGSPVEAEVQMGKLPKDAPTIAIRHGIATLNHYSVRSTEEFERKRLRGRGAKPDEPYGVRDKFKRFDTNSNVDDGIDGHRAKTQSQLARLMRDTVLAFLHSMACQRQFPERASMISQSV